MTDSRSSTLRALHIRVVRQCHSRRDDAVMASDRVMQGDRQAMDRLLELNGELDRYHGFRRAQLAAAAEAAPLRLVPPPRTLLEASSAADPR